MKKRFWAVIGIAAITCSFSAMNVLAASTSTVDSSRTAMAQRFGENGMMPQGGMAPGGFPGGMAPGGTPFEMTDEEKAQMEEERVQREEEMNAFIESLTAEQQALYEAMTPGQQRARPDEDAMTAMQESRDAFIASLSDEQKAEYEELFGGRGGAFGGGKGIGMMNTEMEEKINAFIEMLSDSQKEAFEAIMPAQPTQPVEGEAFVRPDPSEMEAEVDAMKEKQDAFAETLNEEQKAAYDELFTRPERQFNMPSVETGNE